MLPINRKRAPAIQIKKLSTTRIFDRPSLQDHLEIVDLLHDMAKRLDIMEEVIMDNFPCAAQLLGESTEIHPDEEIVDCDYDTEFLPMSGESEEENSSDSLSSITEIDLTQVEDYDPKKYYV